MVDFRRLISPKSQALIAERQRILMEFSESGATEMARILLDRTRQLQNSGCFQTDQRYSYDEWAIYRIVPALACRLDPEVKLLPAEIARQEERNDPVTWLEDGDDDKLQHFISSIISHGSFLRAMDRDVDEDIRRCADHLFGPGVSLLTIAADSVFPGSYPERAEEDQRSPLPGLYVIECCRNGYERVLGYSEDPSLVDRTYDVAVAMQEGEDIAEDDFEIRNKLDRGRLRYPAKGIQIQDFAGTVLREHEVDFEDAPEP